MERTFTELEGILQRTKNALLEYIGILTPIVENARDEHERLFWHHIYEEEEHRSDRLDLLMPKIDLVLNNDADIANHPPEFVVHLLQDISLEKFGLHNFLEHLDLFLLQFKDTELHNEKIQELRDMTDADYQRMKVILEKLNNEFQDGVQFHTSIPTDEKEEKGASIKIDAYSSEMNSNETFQAKKRNKKSLTIGSLKQR